MTTANDLATARTEETDSALGVEEVQGRIKTTDGFEIFHRNWKAVGEARRVVLCIHGMGEHSGFFKAIGPSMAADGAEVYAVDLRGFGNSMEIGLRRGDTSSFERHLQDIEDVMAYVRKNHSGKRLFMFGHSLGGIYILRQAANQPSSLDGAILAAPPIETNLGPRPQDFVILPFLRLFAPKTMYGGPDKAPEDLRRTEEFKLFAEDPLVAQKFSVRYMFGLPPLFRKTFTNASKIVKPTLIIQGQADKMSLPSGAGKLLEKLAAKDKSLRTFPGANHLFYGALSSKPTLEDEGRRKEVATCVGEWLDAH